MKLILQGTDDELFDPATDLRVLVAYSNVAFALRAKTLLARIAQRADQLGRMVFSLWDFNSLAEPVLSPIATEEALGVDIILVAAPEGKVLPKGVRDWMARWLRAKKDFPQALVASLYRDLATAPAHPIVLPYLARVAKRGAMHFFPGAGAGKFTLGSRVFCRSAVDEGPRKFSAIPGLAGGEFRITTLLRQCGAAGKRGVPGRRMREGRRGPG